MEKNYVHSNERKHRSCARGATRAARPAGSGKKGRRSGKKILFGNNNYYASVNALLFSPRALYRHFGWKYLHWTRRARPRAFRAAGRRKRREPKKGSRAPSLNVRAWLINLFKSRAICAPGRLARGLLDVLFADYTGNFVGACCSIRPFGLVIVLVGWWFLDGVLEGRCLAIGLPRAL